VNMLSQLLRASNGSITVNDEMWNIVVVAYFKAALQGRTKLLKYVY
jgi:hypothetical protein